MKKYYQLSSLLLYLLAILVFFIIGLFYAYWIDAGKNQGLAGGAIVFGYGVGGSIFAFIGSLLVVAFSEEKVVNVLNKILTVLLLSFMGYFAIKKYSKGKPAKKQEQEMKVTSPPATTVPAIPIEKTKTVDKEESGKE